MGSLRVLEERARTALAVTVIVAASIVGLHAWADEAATHARSAASGR